MQDGRLSELRTPVQTQSDLGQKNISEEHETLRRPTHTHTHTEQPRVSSPGSTNIQQTRRTRGYPPRTDLDLIPRSDCILRQEVLRQEG
eukprot:6827089-Pyramimonas_sp.AAC.1